MIFLFIVFHSIFCFLFVWFLSLFHFELFWLAWKKTTTAIYLVPYINISFSSLFFFWFTSFVAQPPSPPFVSACLSIHNDVLLPCPASRGLIHWLCMSYCTYSFLYSFDFVAQNNTYIIYCCCEFTFSIKSKKTHTKESLTLLFA